MAESDLCRIRHRSADERVRVEPARGVRVPFSATVKPVLDGRKTVSNTVSSSGGDYREQSGWLEWFELAGYKFEEPKVAFRIAGVGYEAEGVDGVVGRQFLQRFTVVFDYGKRRIAFIRN